MFCVKCGTEYDAKFCPNCGEPAPKKRFCPSCGAEIADLRLTTCNKCGSYVPPVEEESKPKKDETTAQPTIVIHNDNTITNTIMGRKPKNKWTAFLLCFFLGFLGAHKFYEGKTGMGVLYIFTFGLLGFGWLIDCISLLLKPNPYYV